MLYLNDSISTPLTVKMAADRFIGQLLEKDTIFSKAGININGIKLSKAFNIRNKTIYGILNSLRKENGTYNLFHVISAMDDSVKKSDFIDYNNFKGTIAKQEISIYVFTCSDYDVVIPTLLVGDESGQPYVIFSKTAGNLSIKYKQDITEDSLFDAVPVTNNLYRELRKRVQKDDLTEALSKIKSYKIYDLHDDESRILEYFNAVLAKFGLDDLKMNMTNLTEYYINVPIVDFTTDVNGKLNITKCVKYIYDSADQKFKIVYKGFDPTNTSDQVVVLINTHNDARRLTVNKLPRIAEVNGKLTALDKEAADLVESAGESFKMREKAVVRIENGKDVNIINNMRYVEYRDYDDTFAEGFNIRLNDINKKITDEAKKLAEQSLVKDFVANLIKNNNGLTPKGVMESVSLYNRLVNNIKYESKEAVVDYVNNAVHNKAQELYNNKEYNTMLYLYDFADKIRR